MSLKPYPKYKDSGIAWLGEVPEHWGHSSLRWLCSRYSGGTPDKGNIDYWTDGTIPWLNSGAVNQVDITEPSELISEEAFKNSSAKWVPTGALVMALAGQGKTKGMVAQVHFDTTCNQSMAALIPRKNVDARFVFWWLTSNYENVRNMAGGDLRDGLNLDLLGDIQCPLPTVAEQASIAAFLDRETAKIDALIAEQEKLINLLAEKRQATISHAVTKGLHPDAPMKDSGVEWLGEIPAHWELRRLNWLYKFVKRQYGDKIDVLSVYRDFGVIPKSSRDDNINKTPEDLSKYQTVMVGDLVVNKMKAWQGSLGISDHHGITSPDYAVFEPRSDFCHGYVNFLLRNSLLPDVYRSISSGIRPDQWRIEPDKLLSLELPLPPMREQEAIDLHLSAAISGVDRLSAEAESLVDLLKERRIALISSAVTGKVDVRSSATIVAFPIDRRRARGLIAVELIEKAAGRKTFGRTVLQKQAYLAETFVGVSELAGHYVREAYGPFDREMVNEMEREAFALAGIVTNEPSGSIRTVTYHQSRQPGTTAEELQEILGPERRAKLDKLIVLLAPLDTRQTEGVATLFAVWNDFIIDRMKDPTDDEIVLGVLNDWHAEKPENFTATELHLRLSWMRRNRLTPDGRGTKTKSGRLFP